MSEEEFFLMKLDAIIDIDKKLPPNNNETRTNSVNIILFAKLARKPIIAGIIAEKKVISTISEGFYKAEDFS